MDGSGKFHSSLPTSSSYTSNGPLASGSAYAPSSRGRRRTKPRRIGSAGGIEPFVCRSLLYGSSRSGPRGRNYPGRIMGLEAGHLSPPEPGGGPRPVSTGTARDAVTGHSDYKLYVLHGHT